MLKRILIGALVALIPSIGLTAPAFADTNPKTTILQEINDYRAQYGAPALTINPNVENVAQTWAQSLQSDSAQAMMHNPYFGQELAPATQAGEVVSQFYDPNQVVTKWMLSNIHMPILISNSWNAMGIGYVYDSNTGYYWTVVNFAYYPPVTNKPDAPTAPTITAQDTDAAITWNTPADGGSAIQGYDVELYNTDGTSAGGTFTQNTTNTYTFHNLTRGKSYYATVAAYNSMGLGQASPASATIAVQALTPSTPYNLAIYRFASGTVMTTWWAPANLNGSALTGYTVHLYKDGNLYRTINTGDSVYKFTGVPDGATYAFDVTALTTTLPSATSALSGTATLPVIPVQTLNTTPTITPTPLPTNQPSTPIITNQPATTPTITPTQPATPVPVITQQPAPIVTPTTTAPAAPAAIPQPTLKQVSEHVLNVIWQPLTDSAIQTYTIILKTVETGQTVSQTVNGNTATATFTNLLPNATYTATVVAENAAGSSISQASQAVSATTKQTPTINTIAPTKTAIRVKTAAHRKITVTWSAAKTNGGTKIAGYRIVIKTSKWSHTYTTKTTVHAKTITVPTAKKTYTVTVAAYNTANKQTVSIRKNIRSQS